jgi:hypothetical protein
VNDSRKNEALVHRILSGKQIFVHQDNTYELRKPSLSLKMRGDLLYETTYQDHIYDNFWFLEDIDILLFDLQLLSPNYKESLSKLEKNLEKTKINLFQQYFDTTKRKKIKQRIQDLKDNIDSIYSQQHSLDFLTLEHYCDNIKNELIISRTLYFYDSEELVFEQNIDSNLFNQIVTQISKNMISLPSYKKVARSDYWRNYWNNNKTNILDEPVKEWSEEQKSLINISYMYDKIYEHPGCPKDDIIDDDDALDGWMLFQKQENERQKKEKGVESILSGNMKNANEVFLMAGNKEQAQNVLDLNSEGSLATLQQKLGFINSSSTPVRDAQLPDVKQRLMQQLQERG